MPARIPLYRTSEWEIREMGFLKELFQHAYPQTIGMRVPDETESGHGGEGDEQEVAPAEGVDRPDRRTGEDEVHGTWRNGG